MVLINVALLSKSRVHLARNYMPIAKPRNDALLSACSKLLDLQGQTAKSENSYIESDSVRYLYMPLGETYLVLTTTLMSNILEDLSVLRLLQQIVLHYCPHQVTAEAIEENTFDLIFAFDECASFGHQENVTLEQIEQYINCDSHEEKLQNMIKTAKVQDEKLRSRQKALELDKKRLAEIREKRALERTSNAEERFNAATQQLRSSFSSFVRPVQAETAPKQNNPSINTVDIDMLDESPERPRRGRGMKLGGGKAPNLL